jgi:mRNA interferase RelE/StbE
MKQVVYGRAALRTLTRIPANEAKRIRAKINQYADDPASLVQNVVKLQCREGYRLRVGDWRVIFAEDGTVIDIIDIGPRGGIYD